MDVQKTSRIFHTFMKLSYDINQYKSSFAKPHCPCFTSSHVHKIFWDTCEEYLDSSNSITSMVLQILCDINNCCCFDYIYPFLDEIYAILEPSLMALSKYEHHQQSGITQTLVENHHLINFLNLCTKRIYQKRDELIDILQQCKNNHENVLCKFNVCVMCE